MSKSDARKARPSGTDPEKRLGITKQESIVIRAAARGLTDKEIAKSRGITVSSVRTYWDRLRGKLHATGRTHVVAIVSRAKLVESKKALRECEERLTDRTSKRQEA
ncbi:MAG TPA: LuxR C-terminal-related transcriptional regulator [Fimbriimonadaceae bacterium]|nr:LuxR C-terminal-related transcriptional regulator [Fimbriimonadaceae bacterium]